MSDESRYELWNVVGTWLSGVGSLLAVWAALRLASRDRRIQLLIDTDISFDPYVGFNFLTITISNPGRIPANISGLYLKPVAIKRLLIRPIRGNNNVILPEMVTSGSQQSYATDGSAFAENIKKIESQQNQPFINFLLFFLRIEVHTTAGIVFKKRVNKDVRKFVRAEVKRTRAYYYALPD